MQNIEDRHLEILITMEESLLKAAVLAGEYGYAYDSKSSVKFLMNLWKTFHGTAHPRASEFGL